MTEHALIALIAFFITVGIYISLRFEPKMAAAAFAALVHDLLVAAGVYQITPKDPEGKSLADRGKLVEVWKKQADGKWKTVADIFNSDLPAPAPAH